MIKIFKFLIFLLITTTIFSQTWIPQTSPVTSGFQSCSAVNQYVCWFCGIGNIIIKTTNGGTNWLSANGNITSEDFYTIFAIDADNCWVGTLSNVLWHTTNSGVNWVSTTLSPATPAIDGIHFFDTNNGFVIGDPSNGQWRFYITTNGGVNWTLGINSPAASGSEAGWNNSFCAIDTSHILFGTNSSKIYKGSFRGLFISVSTPVNYIFGIAFNDINNGMAIVNNGGINAPMLRTSNGGSDWYNGYTTASIQYSCAGIPGSSYNFFWTCGGVNIYRSTNNGATFTTQLTVTGTQTVSTLSMVNQNCGWAGCSNGAIYKYSDTLYSYFSISGTIYYQDNNQPVTQGYVKALKYDRNTDQIITRDSTGIQSNGTYILSHVPQDSIYIMAYDDDETRPLYVPTYYPSTTNWQNASVLYPTGNLTNINVLVYRVNLSLGVMHIGGGVFSTSSTLTGLNKAIVYAKIGNTYKGYSISGNTGSYRIDSLSSGSYTVVCDRLGYIGDNKNVSLSNINQDTVNFYLQKIVGINKEGNSIPTSFMLYQNYPNPFNPTTKIKFDISKLPLTKGAGGMDVHLIIYDILGREVATLVNEKLFPGKYEVIWDGSNYASGVYFYKLTAGEYTETRKLVLLK